MGTGNLTMGITVWVFTLSFLSSNIFLPASGSEDVELKDPRLLEVTTFAATTLLKDSSLELENFTLQRILDSQVFPQPEPLVKHNTHALDNFHYVC